MGQRSAIFDASMTAAIRDDADLCSGNPAICGSLSLRSLRLETGGFASPPFSGFALAYVQSKTSGRKVCKCRHLHTSVISDNQLETPRENRRVNARGKNEIRCRVESARQSDSNAGSSSTDRLARDIRIIAFRACRRVGRDGEEIDRRGQIVEHVRRQIRVGDLNDLIERLRASTVVDAKSG
jgi:hypothetical protein